MSARTELAPVGIVNVRRELSKATFEDGCKTRGPRNAFRMLLQSSVPVPSVYKPSLDVSSQLLGLRLFLVEHLL